MAVLTLFDHVALFEDPEPTEHGISGRSASDSLRSGGQGKGRRSPGAETTTPLPDSAKSEGYVVSCAAWISSRTY